MTYKEWGDAFNGFGGDAGQKLHDMMYEDWTADREALLREKEQVIVDRNAMLQSLELAVAKAEDFRIYAEQAEQRAQAAEARVKELEAQVLGEKQIREMYKRLCLSLGPLRR